ncbi:c-type cytochrome [Pseudomonas sp. Fl5BN2]|uniref:SorB family sulfite dehydrogenase c-type cytochrome subunit n=2 Tax=unclassified Pseudomonas TaxID=196821 RepID=UPI0015B698A5|nr:c-type cytochrome [Pseudomonas sp. Fl5BN2]
MNRVRYVVVIALLAAAVLLSRSQMSWAESLSIELPPETARFEPSSLPGYAIANAKCSICHSADYIQLQPPGMSQQQWHNEVAKMQHAFGAPIDDQEGDAIAAYLADTYSGKPRAKVAEPPVAGVQGGAQQGAMGLLNANGCLGCHAIDRQVVGPAYQAVAERYRNDPKGVQTLVEHIREGGVGRWGAIPMPPFSTLSEVQLKTLSEFILGQPEAAP